MPLPRSYFVLAVGVHSDIPSPFLYCLKLGLMKLGLHTMSKKINGAVHKNGEIDSN